HRGLDGTTPPVSGQSRLLRQIQALSGALRVRASISRCVRRMLHHSLCSAIGMPHSTQIRTRWGGWLLREKSFFRMDMNAPVNDSNLRRISPQEGLLIRWYLSNSAATVAGEGYNFADSTRRMQSPFRDVSMPTKITDRRIGDVTILQVSGHVILGDG